MMKKMILKIRNKDKGQGLVEFALVLPVIMMITLGVIEVGYLLFSYSSVNSAAREAARYGIAIGDVDGGGQRYYDCSGIIDAGLSIGSFANMNASEFSISYDDGPPPEGQPRNVKYSSCTDLASYSGSDNIEFGDRIVVEVNHPYVPLVSYMGVNIGPFTMTTTSSRTIVKGVELASQGSGEGGGGGGGGGGDDDTGGDDDAPVCYHLDTTVGGGAGGDPSATPSRSFECTEDEYYVAGATINLQAQPSGGWGVGSWTNATSTGSETATATMPSSDMTVTVTYVEEESVCYSLGLTHSSGQGSDPTASPTNSTGCGLGTYVGGEYITLTANPDTGAGYIVGSWSGTNDNSSTSTTNNLTMPSNDTTVDVTYVEESDIPEGCYKLNLWHTGSGSDPVPNITSSGGCPETYYSAWTSLSFMAYPEPGNIVGYWSGTSWSAEGQDKRDMDGQVGSGDTSIGVHYAAEEIIGGPIILNTSFTPDGNKCPNVTYNWAVNPDWDGKAPIYYEIFYNGYDMGDFYNTTSWTNWVSLNHRTQVIFGVRAIFTNGLQYSQTTEVDYLCSFGNMIDRGQVIKEFE